MMGHYMLISACNKFLCTDAEGTQCDFEDAGLCQKNVRTEPLNGSIMPRAMDLSSVLKARMYLYTIALLLVMVIALCQKGRRSSSLPHGATKAGKHQRSQRHSERLRLSLQGCSILRGFSSESVKSVGFNVAYLKFACFQFDCFKFDCFEFGSVVPLTRQIWL